MHVVYIRMYIQTHTYDHVHTMYIYMYPGAGAFFINIKGTDLSTFPMYLIGVVHQKVNGVHQGVNGVHQVYISDKI